MSFSRLFRRLLLSSSAAVLVASQPWSKAPEQWNDADVTRVLSASPWVQGASVIFPSAQEEPAPAPLPGPAQAGMAGGNAASSQRWDGGVGNNKRGGVPTLSVAIRWDSARPLQLAHKKAGSSDPFFQYATAEALSKDYILTVVGLVPARAYRAKASPSDTSVSDDSVDTRNPESMLEGFMSSSKLQAGAKAVSPEDVKFDGATGEVHLFFPRSLAITSRTKEIRFTTAYGSLRVDKIFRVQEMAYRGKIEL